MIKDGHGQGSPSAGSVPAPNSSKDKVLRTYPINLNDIGHMGGKSAQACSMLCSSPISAKTFERCPFPYHNRQAGAVRLIHQDKKAGSFQSHGLAPVLGPVMTRVVNSGPAPGNGYPCLGSINGCRPFLIRMEGVFVIRGLTPEIDRLKAPLANISQLYQNCK